MISLQRESDEFGWIWRVMAVRRIDGHQLTASMRLTEMPTRETCAREVLKTLAARGAMTPPVIRGFGDIALLRAHGYEIAAVTSADCDVPSAGPLPGKAQPAAFSASR